MFDTNDGIGSAMQTACSEIRPAAAPKSLTELSQSTLPPMLLLLLMTAGQRDGTEPLGRAIDCLGALQALIETGRDGSSPEARRLSREAVSAMFSAVSTLRRATN